MDRPELTDQALGILRNGDVFQWHVITLAAFVTYVYFVEIQNRNWNAIASGLALYMTHWFYEIGNALIQHFSGHALWTVPAGTSVLLLVGVGIEISMMFSVTGVIVSKILPSDPKLKIFGVNNRWLIAVGFAAAYSFVEIFLAKTQGFHWVYQWWGAFPVFITVYVPFFLAATLVHDWTRKKQVRFIGGLAAINAALLIVCGGIMGWI